MKEQENQIQLFFFQIMQNYLKDTEYAQKALDVILAFGETFFNDHVAFRSFKYKHFGIQQLEKVFLSLGYEKKDNMKFEEKKLNSFWYLPPSLDLPKVFISELEVEQLPKKSVSILEKYLDASETIKPFPKSTEDMIQFMQNRPWETPSYEDYQSLLSESEYAAWTLAFGNRVNHFTLSVNHFKKIRNIFELNYFLQTNEIPMNDSSGIVKGNAEKTFLLQSATIANAIDVDFKEGPKQIPYAFMEFAERFLLPENAKQHYSKPDYRNYFQGFVPTNADKIFESTYRSQTER